MKIALIPNRSKDNGFAVTRAVIEFMLSHCVEIYINGKEVGKLTFGDSIDISKFVNQGENTVDLVLYSGNRNLLGPHHLIDRDMDTEVVPSSFDFSESWSGDSSPEFTARYSFAKFGLFDK